MMCIFPIHCMQELADRFEMSGYMETSAKDNINVSETFEALTREILRGGLLGGDSYEEQNNIIHIRKTEPQTKKKSCCDKK